MCRSLNTALHVWIVNKESLRPYLAADWDRGRSIKHKIQEQWWGGGGRIERVLEAKSEKQKLNFIPSDYPERYSGSSQ